MPRPDPGYAAGGKQDGRRRPAFSFAAVKRTVGLVIQFYPRLFPAVCVLTIFSSAVSAIPSIFTQKIIAIIAAWTESGDWAAAKALIVRQITPLIVLYVLSLIAVVLQTQLGAILTQGFLDRLRRRLFDTMQDLPIRYFDSHKHGDIMSHYTNDVDTLRELVSQSIPAVLRSGSIVIVVFGIMLWYSVPLTAMILLGVAAMLLVSGKLGGGSARFFIAQQKSVAATEGFIQEMMAGQKVVRVFNHEAAASADFDRLNAALFPEGTEGLEVYEWTTDWSEYFDEGREWWGTLCLTVYDKGMDRFVVILASATD